MPNIIYVQPDGTEEVVDAEEGQSLMEGAVQNGIKGIDAECGGACSCATCHAYIDLEWHDKIPQADEVEREMLEFAYETKEDSRLTCQIPVSKYLDGLRVRIPEAQA